MKRSASETENVDVDAEWETALCRFNQCLARKRKRVFQCEKCFHVSLQQVFVLVSKEKGVFVCPDCVHQCTICSRQYHPVHYLKKSVPYSHQHCRHVEKILAPIFSLPDTFDPVLPSCEEASCSILGIARTTEGRVFFLEVDSRKRGSLFEYVQDGYTERLSSQVVVFTDKTICFGTYHRWLASRITIHLEERMIELSDGDIFSLNLFFFKKIPSLNPFLTKEPEY